MTTAETLGLTPEDFATLIGILDRYAPKTPVWAFGSRTQGRARPFSDLDLVIVNAEPLPLQTRAELTYALSESNLPMKTDLIEWARTNAAFRELIERNHIILKAA